MSWKTIVAVVALAVAGATAHADSYQVVATYQYDYTTLAHGEVEYIGGPTKGTMTIIGSTGAPFVVGESFASRCLVFSRREGEGLELEAPCVDTSPSGSVLYSRFRQTQGEIGADGGGTREWELLGGSGEFEGVSGSCRYNTRYHAEFLVVIADCQYGAATS